MYMCSKCGSSNVEEGVLESHTSNLTFRSKRAKNIISITPRVDAWVCLNCGYIESYADKSLLEKLEQELNK
jgi:predicted nucleic-acid-binding Zn-ribbon protein